MNEISSGTSISKAAQRLLPQVSVIIPVFNGKRYVEAAIESVLAQRHGSMEILAVDDGSTDGSGSLLSRFGGAVAHVVQPNVGSNGARNRGVRLSRGEFIAFLDQDDLWMPDKMQLQLEAFHVDPDLDMVFGYVEQFFSPEIPEADRRGWVDTSQRIPGIHVGTLLIRRRSFRRVGDFNEDRKYGQFLEWYARAIDMDLRRLMLPQTVMRRRVHTSNMTLRSPIEARQAFTHALKATLDRRRQDKAPPSGAL